MSHEPQPIGSPMPDTDEISPDHIFTFKSIAGVQHGGCRALVWLPTETNQDQTLPVALLYHGGGFSLGSPRDVPYHHVRYMLEKGVVVISFGYRLLPHVGIEEILEDLLDSYRYVQGQFTRDLDSAGVSIRIDPGRCSAHGWSAGGSSVVYLASEISRHNGSASNQDQLPPLRCIVPTYPMVQLDIMCKDKTGWDQKLESEQALSHCWANLLAQPCLTENRMDLGRFATAQTVLSGDETALAGLDLDEYSRHVWISQVTVDDSLVSWLCGTDAPYPERLEGIKLVSADFPPTCVVAASADTLIPPIQSHNLAQAVRACGVEAVLFECEGMIHGQAEALANSPSWPENNGWWESAIRPSLDFAIRKMTEA